MAVIWCLHGFLGRGADWDFLRAAGFDIRAPSLFSGDSLDDIKPAAGDFILGYSMGARLALRWGAADLGGVILISTGLTFQEPGRQELDETWAKRFETEKWDDVTQAWNAQSVFANRPNPLTRNESDYDRRKLAAALRDYSPAVMHTSVAGIKVPTLWIAGQDDKKYVDAATRAAGKVPNAQLWICPDAAHRVPWEQPERFIERLRRFVSPSPPR